MISSVVQEMPILIGTHSAMVIKFKAEIMPLSPNFRCPGFVMKKMEHPKVREVGLGLCAVLKFKLFCCFFLLTVVRNTSSCA